ncbi:hypothetical protein PPERSA_11115 [Pseudocohnilembus persalinus]|uniref:Uncharacterized protein n=1 Tax=Pseudocohnilembus persalinus TaxID=266149 RepID=A0A0V0QZA5_PSEPJ|nr:hypothetical protein PPERSA_11115 [Pseudocohnilembus persalinus]|eukprot:KRX07566.1 hypothetical protein PPERSA_11115 [Pseudocohnilembus persalinus]
MQLQESSQNPPLIAKNSQQQQVVSQLKNQVNNNNYNNNQSRQKHTCRFKALKNYQLPDKFFRTHLDIIITEDFKHVSENLQNKFQFAQLNYFKKIYQMFYDKKEEYLCVDLESLVIKKVPYKVLMQRIANCGSELGKKFAHVLDKFNQNFMLVCDQTKIRDQKNHQKAVEEMFLDTQSMVSMDTCDTDNQGNQENFQEKQENNLGGQKGERKYVPLSADLAIINSKKAQFQIQEEEEIKDEKLEKEQKSSKKNKKQKKTKSNKGQKQNQQNQNDTEEQAGINSKIQQQFNQKQEQNQGEIQQIQEKQQIYQKNQELQKYIDQLSDKDYQERMGQLRDEHKYKELRRKFNNKPMLTYTYAVNKEKYELKLKRIYFNQKCITLLGRNKDYFMKFLLKNGFPEIYYQNNQYFQWWMSRMDKLSRKHLIQMSNFDGKRFQCVETRKTYMAEKHLFTFQSFDDIKFENLEIENIFSNQNLAEQLKQKQISELKQKEQKNKDAQKIEKNNENLIKNCQEEKLYLKEKNIDIQDKYNNQQQQCDQEEIGFLRGNFFQSKMLQEKINNMKNIFNNYFSNNNNNDIDNDIDNDDEVQEVENNIDEENDNNCQNKQINGKRCGYRDLSKDKINKVSKIVKMQ